jgi:small GTP-binding protein
MTHFTLANRSNRKIWFNDRYLLTGNRLPNYRMAESKLPVIKVVMLGSPSVGKTCLLHRWCTDHFDSTLGPTYSAGFQSQTVEFEGSSYSLQIWDTAGQDQFSNTTKLYCHSARAAMIVFDLSEPSTFEDVPKWIEKLNSDSPVDVPFLLVGNKLDLRVVVSQEEVDALLEMYPIAQFVRTSAKRGDFVDDAFSHLVTIACDSRVQTTPEPPAVVIGQDGQTSTGGGPLPIGADCC